MRIINFLILITVIFSFTSISAKGDTFESWIISFKREALKQGITEKTFDISMKNVKFLPKVIEYDRYQPEFYEDTHTYISKRSSKKKINKGIIFYNKNKNIIEEIDNTFEIEKELLLALMGIETNFGTYVGKMDILSSLATLSYDKRRSKFFTKELITILQLIEKNIIDHNTLYGSWAGAFGYFQFMPSTINRYAIDFNNNNLIELKNNSDAFASAANYLKKMGWKKNSPCFLKVDLKSNIPNKYLNTSAQSIKHKKKLKFFKKFIKDFDNSIDENLLVAVITPDAEIVDNSNKYNPAYIIFNNYELILKWNRSLRFGLAVCTLKKKFENEL